MHVRVPFRFDPVREDRIAGHVDEPVLRALQRAQVPGGDGARAARGV